MATSPVRLPTSNVAGNNQTSPGVGASAARVPIVPFSARAEGNGTMNPFNPFMHSMGSMMGSTPSDTSTGSLYDPSTSPGYNGQSNIGKQLTDMYGKGVGGMLDNLLKGMSGDDSAIFQQWLASMKPVEASERAGLQGTLASEGVSGNSSVSAIANSNLTGEFNAQAAGVNSQLMQSQLQDTLSILMGTRGDASKEVASSGWGVFADVMNNITGDAGNLMGGSYKSSGSNYGGIGSADNGAAAQLPNFGAQSQPNELDQLNTQNMGADWLNTSQVDTSIFDSAPADVTFGF
jgi:hypothetical protein